MKFLVAPTAEAVARARPPVKSFLLFALAALAGLAGQRATLGQLNPQGVLDHYFPGGEAQPTVALVEELHAGAFVYGALLLTLGALLVVTPLSARVRGALTWAPAAACAADLAAPFLLAAGAPPLLRVASFALAAGLLAAAALTLLVRFGRPARAAGARRG